VLYLCFILVLIQLYFNYAALLAKKTTLMIFSCRRGSAIKTSNCHHIYRH